MSSFLRWCREAEQAGMESIRVDSPEIAREAPRFTTLAFRVAPEIATTDGAWIVSWKIGEADVEAVGKEMELLRSNAPAATLEIEGDTTDAAWLAIKHADRLFRRADRLDQAYADALPVLHMGVEVGLSAFVIARRTRDEAVAAAGELFGAPGVLSGPYEGIADALVAYGRKGIGHFLLRGREGHDDLRHFGEGVLPRVRALEESRCAVA